MQEEVNEFMEAENIEEMADVMEVVGAICDYKNFDKEELQKVKDKKAEERGKFKDKIILDES